MTTRDDAKSYLRTLSMDEMTELCDEVLQEGWWPRQIPLGWTFVLRSCSDRIRAIKVVRRIFSCTMVEAQDIVNSFPFEFSKESYHRKDVEMFKALFRDNGISFKVTENLVDDPYDYPPTIQYRPMA